MTSSIERAASAPRTSERGPRFDYAALDMQTARAIRVSTERIRHILRCSLKDVLEIGAELISVKQTLPHGEFRRWLHSEFGWKERSARNFMNVAQRFKSASIADLQLELTAAYLLAAPSAPERARTLAIERAKNGECITYASAQEIIAETRSKRKNGQPSGHRAHPRERTLKSLDRLKRQWPGETVQELARLLREFADSLENTSETRLRD